MFTPPDDLDLDLLDEVVRAGWGVDAVGMDYQAVGFGSHHWLATAADGDRWFVTVDVLSAKPSGFDGLQRALGSACVLRHDAGLGFVIAPDLTVDGETLRRVGDAHAVAVYGIVDGYALRPGRFPSDDLRVDVLRLVAALHQASSAVTAIAGRADFELPSRAGLEAALDELGVEWTGGPYAEPARELLAHHAADVRRGLATFDRLVDAVMTSAAPWVLTHGEPHAQNVMITDAGPVLIDWDTALTAPPERDLWMLMDGDDSLEAYAEITGHRPDPNALMLYRLGWDLGEVAGYMVDFRRPHRNTTDSQVAWGGLGHSIAVLDRLA